MSDASDDRRRAGAVRLVAALQDAGFVAYWAGGCVRDRLLRRTPKDYDVATAARPDDVSRLFPGALPVGRAFGVMLVKEGDLAYEVATFRTDASYSDGRHPDAVIFSTPEEDAARRDFTINAMFYDPITDRVLDYVNGQADLTARIVRCVGDPGQRFREDHLRMLRAVRFASTLDFEVEPATADAIRAQAPLAGHVAAERTQEELTRILMESTHAGAAVRLMDALGLLPVLLPEVAAMKGQAQPPEFHPEGDVFNHTVLMLDGLRERTVPLVYAALLHDVAKPLTARQAADRLRFDGHAERGAEVAEEILKRLKFSRALAEEITACVRGHMRMQDVTRMKRSTLRRLIGSPTFATEFELHRLDCLASHGDLSNHRFLEETRRQFADEPVLPPPWIVGRDILQLGIPEGPRVGAWLRRAYEAQIDGRFESRDDLLRWVAENIRAAPDT